MKTLILKVFAPQASFRRPLDINYQRTLPLPPPSTLIGLAGAALGLSDIQIWNKPEGESLRNTRVSAILCNNPGLAKDLITILKVKNRRIEDRSPYYREVLFNTEFLIIYHGKEKFIQKLKEGFQNPQYPLSLGREDELIDILSIEEADLQPGEPAFRGTAIPGDIRKMDFQLAEFKEKKDYPIKIEPPIIESVPVVFDVTGKSRIPRKKVTLSFLPYTLEVGIKSPTFEVFSVKGKNFTWMNY